MEEQTEKATVLHNFQKQNTMNSMFSKSLILVLAFIALLGVGTGYLLSSKGKSSGSSVTVNTSGSTEKGTVEGSNDLETYKDIAEGTLEDGGFEGEGQYHLVRPGGDSQTVYLTSAIVDLSAYIVK